MRLSRLWMADSSDQIWAGGRIHGCARKLTVSSLWQSPIACPFGEPDARQLERASCVALNSMGDHHGI